MIVVDQPEHINRSALSAALNILGMNADDLLELHITQSAIELVVLATTSGGQHFSVGQGTDLAQHTVSLRIIED